MNKRSLLLIAGLTCLAFLAFPRFVFAYMDPGSMGSLFAVLAPVIAIILGALAFFLRPVRGFFKSAVTKLRRGSKNKTQVADDQSSADDLTDDDSSGENIGEASED
jgi:hypothetical protein